MCFDARKLREEIEQGATYSDIAASYGVVFKKIEMVLKEQLTSEEYEEIMVKLASNIQRSLDIDEGKPIFILDTSFLIKDMSFLEANSSCGRIIVPYDVLQELLGKSQQVNEETGEPTLLARTVESIGNKLYTLEERKIIRILPLMDEKNPSFSLTGLSYFDQRILTMVSYYARKSGTRVILLTNDGKLKMAASKYGIEAADAKTAEWICAAIKRGESVAPLTTENNEDSKVDEMNDEPRYKTYYNFSRFLGRLYSNIGPQMEKGKLVIHLDSGGGAKKLKKLRNAPVSEGFLVERGDLFIFIFPSGKVKIYRIQKPDVSMRKYYNLSLISLNKYYPLEKAWRSDWPQELFKVRDFLMPKMEGYLKKMEREKEAV